MSAAQLTRRLLSIDVERQEDEFIDCIYTVINEFLESRNPIFPRQDVIIFLMKAFTKSSRVTVLKLILTALSEFCTHSTTYDHNFVKKQLVDLKAVSILCSNLSGSLLHKDIQFMELCLLLLRRLSDVLLPSQLQLVLTDIIPLCVTWCNPKKPLLFAFSSTLKQQLRELLLGNNLIMKVTTYDSGASKEKVDLMKYLLGCGTLQLNHCTGEVYDTRSSEDRNISDMIVTNNLAWNQPESPADNDQAPGVFRDIIPSEIIYGPHFFAHELDKVKQIADIELLLQDVEHAALKSSPSLGDLVTAWGYIDSPHSTDKHKEIYFRAQITYQKSDHSYLVVALDYGQVKEVQLQHLYQPCTSLIHIMPSTTLCTIKGLQPCPLSINILESALSILQTLTRGNFTIGEELAYHLQAVNLLLHLASISPYEDICVRVMTILLHIAHNSRVRTTCLLQDEPVVQVMALLRRFSELNWREAVISGSLTLSSMVMDNPSVTDQFEKGFKDLMRCVGVYSKDDQVKKVLLQVVRNYLGAYDISSSIKTLTLNSDTYSPIQSPTLHQKSADSSYSSSISSHSSSPFNAESRSSDTRSESESEAVTFRGRGRAPPARSRSGSHLNERKGGSQPIRTLSGSELRKVREDPLSEPKPEAKMLDNKGGQQVVRRRSRSGSTHRTIDKNILSQQGKSASPHSSLSDLRSSKSKDFYVLGEQTNLTTSSSCEVFDSSKKLDCGSIRKLVAGFLNAGINGRLVYGVSPTDTSVVGMEMDRDYRDQLRLGLDRICKDFQPSLTCHGPKLYFIPVCLPDGADQPHLRTFLPDRYVVEIVIESPASFEGYTLNGGELYMRIDGETRQCCVQDIRETVTRMIELEYS